MKKINIEKSVKLKDLSFVEPPEDILLTNNDDIIELIINMKLSKELLKFYKVLVTNFDSKDLNTYYHNIRSLRIKEFNFDKLRKKSKREVLAFYKHADNTIYIPDFYEINSIYHELFHMSSSKRIKNNYFSGFHMFDLENIKSYAEGINEGYTQLLSERYFDDALKDSYKYFAYVMKLIEEIIGKNIMESLYMKSSLYGLIDELKKYSSYEDIKRFITYMDYLIINIYDTKSSNKKISLMGEMIKYINMFIISLCINKWKLNPPCDEEGYKYMAENIEYFLNQTVTKIYISNKLIDCSLSSDEEYMEDLIFNLNDLDIDLNTKDEKKLV